MASRQTLSEPFDSIDDQACDAYASLGAICLRGARGNLQDRRRRAFSMRWVGDDGHYTERQGRTSPPYPGHGMRNGQKLREDWFPVLWPRNPAQ